MKIIAAWLGNADIQGAKDSVLSGPVFQALQGAPYDQLLLLFNQDPSDAALFVDRLKEQVSIEIKSVASDLSSPTNFEEIYQAASSALDDCLEGVRPIPELTFHLSPGTPPMAAIWIILSSTRYPAKLIQSSRERGVEKVRIPFEISAEFIPKVMEAADQKLRKTIMETPDGGAKFGDIIYQSPVMGRVVRLAQKVALRNIEVVIQGESGTGKELMARAIHSASPRSNRPFVPVNCGAIPRELVETELFGSASGAFTGAENRAGVFEEASSGTLFLDEIGDLPLEAQVKLLRALQERKITRVGETRTRPVDVRIIVATNRNLKQAVRDGHFRDDLLYRLLVVELNLPPLRDREGDLVLLAKHLLVEINRASEQEERNYQHKTLSPGANNIILRYSWPGNVRELQNTLRRAALWQDSKKLTKEDLKEALISIPMPGEKESHLLDQPLGEDFDLAATQSELVQHYLHRAMIEANNNKTQAAKLLGLPSYQTMTNWLKRYDLG